MSRTRPWVGLALLLVAAGVLPGCADRASPAWPEGAELTVDEVGVDHLTLTWPQAEDRRGVAGYRIVMAGEILAEVADQRHFTVAGLDEFSQVELEVVARDEAGNHSLPLGGVFRTADVSPPLWRYGLGGLHHELHGGGEERSLELSWGAVEDNDRVDRFVITRDGVEVAITGGEERAATVSDGSIAGNYSIRPCDPSGNCGRALLGEVDEQGRDARDERERIETKKIPSLDLMQIWLDSEMLDTLFATTGDSVSSPVGAEILTWDGEDFNAGLKTNGAEISRPSLLFGSSDYRPPSATVSGGEPLLVAHAEKRRARIEHCYQNALTDDAGLSGSLTASLSADAEGAVTVGGVSGVGGSPLTSCVATALRGRLAEAPGAPLSGSVTIQLDPGTRTSRRWSGSTR